MGRFVFLAVVVLSSLGLAAAGESKTPGTRKLVANSVGATLVLVPAGEFTMGSGETADDTARFFNKARDVVSVNAELFSDEHPQHRVRITRSFYLGTVHVTRGQFRRFVEDTGYKTDIERAKPVPAVFSDPTRPYVIEQLEAEEQQRKSGLIAPARDATFDYSWRKVGFEQTDDHPVLLVSWNDATAFCGWLSRKEGKTFRLPTEAEWEYACRAGTSTRYYSGDNPETLAKVANVADATLKAKCPRWKGAIKGSDGYAFTAPVGLFRANAFGLYDMHGNARQWCSDFYAEGYYAKSPADEPRGPSSGTYRVVRGSAWADMACFARSANRVWGDEVGAVNYLTGFRVATDGPNPVEDNKEQ